MLRKITEIKSPLVVGKYYLVPCVSLNIDSPGYKAGQKIPVIPNFHDDPEIGVDIEHYHYDRRFIKNPPSLINIIAFEANYSNPEVVFSEISWEKRKCQSNDTWFPSALCDRLEENYQSSRLKDSICPHRLTYLGNIPPDETGNVICPSHGLRWNLETGCLVSRIGG